MASVIVNRYQSMKNAGHPEPVVFQRLIMDLQITPHPAADQFVRELFSENGVISQSVLDELDALAKTKYQRMEARGDKPRHIELIRANDHYVKPQEGYVPKIGDPIAFSAGEEFDDTVVGDSFDVSTSEPLSHQRAREYRKEAGKRRKEFFKSMIDAVRMDPQATLIGRSSSNSTQTKTTDASVLAEQDFLEPEVQEKMGKFYNDPLECSFHASCILPEKMYMLENLFPAEECAKIVQTLNFSEDEQLLKQRLVEELSSGAIVMRTSLKRSFVHPHVAHAIWQAVRQVLPNQLSDGRTLAGVRTKMNFFRYASGEFFTPHIDGGHVFRDSGLHSEYTFVIYLNDDCLGGSTRFYDVNEWKRPGDSSGNRQINPQQGSMLIFRQKGTKHCGAPVVEGFKYIIQGMIFCNPSNETPTIAEFQAVETIGNQ